MDGEYGQSGVCAGAPAIIGSGGIQELLELNLNEEENKKLQVSCSIIRRGIESLHLEERV
ncbi:L-lactate dehydrogenase 2 [compost metagenome]